jgi:hypothetical protein
MGSPSKSKAKVMLRPMACLPVCLVSGHNLRPLTEFSLRSPLNYLYTDAVFLLWCALSDERSSLSFTVAAGPRQHSLSYIRIPQASWPFLLSQFGTPPTWSTVSLYLFPPKKQVSSVIPLFVWTVAPRCTESAQTIQTILPAYSSVTAASRGPAEHMSLLPYACPCLAAAALYRLARTGTVRHSLKFCGTWTWEWQCWQGLAALVRVS